MSSWALQDAFLIKPLFSRPGLIADTYNTKEETQRPRQNEKVEEYVPNKRTSKKPERGLSEMEVASLLDKDFTVTIKDAL